MARSSNPHRGLRLHFIGEALAPGAAVLQVPGKGGRGSLSTFSGQSLFNPVNHYPPPPGGSGRHSNCTDPSQAARRECAEVKHVGLDTYFLASSFWRSSGFGGVDLITMQAEPNMCLEKENPAVGHWNDHSVSRRARYFGTCSVGESERV